MKCIKIIWGLTTYQSGPTLLEEMEIEPILVTIEKLQIDYLTKIIKSDNELLKNSFNHHDGWKKRLNSLASKWDINLDDIENMTTKQIYKLTKHKKQERIQKEIRNMTKNSNSHKHKTRNDKSCCDEKHNNYKDITTIWEARNIFKLRTDTVQIPKQKNNENYDENHNRCIICNNETNTTRHYMNECWPIRDVTSWVNYNDYFKCHDHDKATQK